MNVSDDLLLKEYIQNHNLKPNSIKHYNLVLRTYSKFVGMPPSKWITEAEKEEESRIRMRQRKIKNYLLNFKTFLHDQDHTVLTVRNYMGIIKGFYLEYEIEIPRIRLKKDTREESREDIPTVDDIKFALSQANTKYKAIILLMASSGMGASEIISLSINDFIKSLQDYTQLPSESIVSVDVLVDIIEKKKKKKLIIVPTWHITRIKTEMPYVTFSSPESVDAIINYLKTKPTKNMEDPLFRGPLNKSIDHKAFFMYFNRLNRKCGFGKPDREAFFRSHALRKYFATTISEEIPKLKVDRMLGHRVDSQTNSYFKTNLPELKETYIKAIPFISIENTETRILESPEYQELKEQYEEESRLKDEEMKDLQEQLIDLDDRLKKNERFFERLSKEKKQSPEHLRDIYYER